MSWLTQARSAGKAAGAKAASRVAQKLPDARGQTTASKAVGLVVGLMVAALMAAYLLPVAIDELVNVDTTSWSSNVVSLWDLLPLLVVLALVLFIIGVALSAADRL